jgi:hypothetical protein
MPDSALPELGLVIVRLSNVVSLVSMSVDPNVFSIFGGNKAVSVAVALPPAPVLVPPSVDET